MRKLGAGVLGTLLVVLSTLFIAPGTASADAYSCTGYGGVQIPNTNVSPARFCVLTKGKGRNVAAVAATFFALAPPNGLLCNTRFKVEAFADNEESLGSVLSPVVKGCFQRVGSATFRLNYTFPTDGFLRISLLSYGAEKAAIEQTIKG